MIMVMIFTRSHDCNTKVISKSIFCVVLASRHTRTCNNKLIPSPATVTGPCKHHAHLTSAFKVPGQELSLEWPRLRGRHTARYCSPLAVTSRSRPTGSPQTIGVYYKLRKAYELCPTSRRISLNLDTLFQIVVCACVHSSVDTHM